MENAMIKLKDILLEKLTVTVDEITESADFRTDLGADSLDLVEIIMAVENEFGVEISDNDIEKINTVGDALNILKNNMK